MRGGALRTLLFGALLLPTGQVEAAAPALSGEHAMKWVRRQCAFGPRVPGTTAHARCLSAFRAHLDSLGVSYRAHPFKVKAPADGRELACTNLIISIRPEARPRLLLGSHWDSRPWADQDPNPQARAQPVLGANDGASSTALLLTLARVLRDNPPPIGVDLVLFDAEDLGRDDKPEEFCLGSQRLASEWVGRLPDWVLVLDMVGAPGAQFGRELYSQRYHPEFSELIFELAARRGFAEFNPSIGYAITDDHLPWLRRGVPSALIIGWGDPNWHTLRDTPDRLSPATLERVGTVVLDLIYGGELPAP